MTSRPSHRPVSTLRKLSPYWGEAGPVDQAEAGFAPAYA